MAAFVVKDWKDSPDASTPLSQAALEDMETRLSAYSDTLAALCAHLAGTETIAGQKTFSLPILLPDGTNALPALAFASDTNTGLYRTGADAVAITVGGNAYVTIDSTGNLIINGGFIAWGGAPGTPGIGFAGDTDTGIRSVGANAFAIVTGGSDRLSIDSAGVVTIAGRVAGYDALASLAAAVGPIANTETRVIVATIPANQMQAGTTYRVRATGVSTAAGATAGSTFNLRVGTTTLTGNIAATLTGTSAAGTNIPFSLEALVTVRTAGAGGTVIGSITYNANAATGALNATVAVGQVVATVAVDTTAQKLVELTYISGAAGTSITVHNAVVELVKA